MKNLEQTSQSPQDCLITVTNINTRDIVVLTWSLQQWKDFKKSVTLAIEKVNAINDAAREGEDL